jgi:hypothetical protein
MLANLGQVPFVSNQATLSVMYSNVHWTHCSVLCCVVLCCVVCCVVF